MATPTRFANTGSGSPRPVSWLWALVLAACGGGGGAPVVSGGAPVVSGGAPQSSQDDQSFYTDDLPEIQFHLQDWLRENGVDTLPKTNTENRGDREIVAE